MQRSYDAGMTARRRRSILAALLIAAALVAGTTIWIRRDPLDVLPRSAGAPVTRVDWIERPGGRICEHVTLSDERLGSIGFVVSLPEPQNGRKLPIVLVLGGLGTGEHNIEAIRDSGDNVIVGYDWPFAAVSIRSSELPRVSALRAQVLSVPGQVAAALGWLVRQPWSDPDRVSLVGFSLGAVAAPAVQRLVAAEHIQIGWTILAYGGAPIFALVTGDTRLRPSWARPLLAGGAEVLLAPIDPAFNLPELTGRFLVLRSTDDSIVSDAASRRLEALTPSPKRTIQLPGGQVGTGSDRAAILEGAMAAAQSWLIGEGAVNSPASGSGSCAIRTLPQ